MSDPIIKTRKPKRVTSWRVCPECGSRATKIFNISAEDNPLECQACHHKYNPPEATERTV